MDFLGFMLQIVFPFFKISEKKTAKGEDIFFGEGLSKVCQVSLSSVFLVR